MPDDTTIVDGSSPPTPSRIKFILENNLVWFALGMLVAGAIGTVSFYSFLEKRIADLTPMLVDKALREDPLGATIRKVQSDSLAAYSQALSELDRAKTQNTQAAEKGKEAQRQADRLQTSLTELQNSADAMKGLRQFSESIQTAVSEALKPGGVISDQVLRSIQLPPGAVMAFDREDNCPQGWVPYKAAGGRFIIGAGDHDNVGLRKYKLSEVGGEERHVLSIEELPAHDHKLQTQRSRNMQGANDYILDEFVGRDKPEIDPKRGTIVYTEKTGGGSAFNILNPYIALHYCRKTASALAGRTPG
jgi:hypothetical protein